MLTNIEVSTLNTTLPDLPIGATPNTDPIQLRNIEGLGPVKSTITTVPRVLRGEVFSGKTIPKRNIVFTLGLNPDWDEHTITSLRQRVYSYFMTGEWVKLRFFSDELPPVEIEGYVESVDPNIFSKDPELQISVICPQPDFIAVDPSIFEGLVSLGDEIVFEYGGTVPTGIFVEVRHNDDVPTFNGGIGLYVARPDAIHGDIQIGSDTDILIDSTQFLRFSSLPGNKYIQTVDSATDEVTSVLGNTLFQDPWPLLQAGDNVFSLYATSDYEGQSWTMTFYERYGGL